MEIPRLEPYALFIHSEALFPQSSGCACGDSRIWLDETSRHTWWAVVMSGTELGRQTTETVARVARFEKSSKGRGATVIAAQSHSRSHLGD